MTPRFFHPALMVFGIALLLPGCTATAIPQCPGAAILADVATRPVLKPGNAAADPAAALYILEITGIETSCVLDKQIGQVDSHITLSFRATRAPSGQGAHYTAPYFVAINQAERIINKRVFDAQFDFAPGAASITFTAVIDSTKLKLENGHLGTDYQFLVGMDVSDAERAYLKTMGRYAP